MLIVGAAPQLLTAAVGAGDVCDVACCLVCSLALRQLVAVRSYIFMSTCLGEWIGVDYTLNLVGLVFSISSCASLHLLLLSLSLTHVPAANESHQLPL